MDFELQSICVIRPPYFTTAVLLLFASAIASGISTIIALKRRIRGDLLVSPPVVKFHIGVILVWLAYAAVLGVGWAGDRRGLQEYERTAGKVAPAIRAAMNREARVVSTFGLACAGVGLLSMVAWHGIGRRSPDPHAA